MSRDKINDRGQLIGLIFFRKCVRFIRLNDCEVGYDVKYPDCYSDKIY